MNLIRFHWAIKNIVWIPTKENIAWKDYMIPENFQLWQPYCAQINCALTCKKNKWWQRNKSEDKENLIIFHSLRLPMLTSLLTLQKAREEDLGNLTQPIQGSLHNTGKISNTTLCQDKWFSTSVKEANRYRKIFSFTIKQQIMKHF